MTSALRQEAVTEQEAQVIRWREEEGVTLDEIAARVGKSKERVRQMIREAKARLDDFAQNGDDALSRLPAHAVKVMGRMKLRTRAEVRAAIGSGQLWWSNRFNAAMWESQSVRTAGWGCWVAFCEWCGLPKPVRGHAADDPPLPPRVRDLTEVPPQSLNHVVRSGLSAATSRRLARSPAGEQDGHAKPTEPKELCGYFRFRAPGATAEPLDDETLAFFSVFKDARHWRADAMENQLVAEKAKWAELLSKVPGSEEVVAKLTSKDEGPRNDELDAVERAALQMKESIPVLIDAALAGDGVAAEELLQNASWMTAFLQMLYGRNPKLFAGVAKKMAHLPVLACIAPGWKTAAVQNMDKLGLGTEIARGHFKETAYRDDFHPCRKWARLAVESLESNKVALGMHAEVSRYLVSTQQTSVVLRPLPTWVCHCADLPPYSKASAPQWGRLAREMIREQVPEFHEHHDFRELVSNAKTRMRHEPGAASRRVGTLQNAILDRISETIESIAL